MRMRNAIAVLTLIVAVTPAAAQVGGGLADVNQIPEAEVAKLPHVPPAIAKQILERRPFASIDDLHALLTGAGLAATQTAEVYGRAFVHVNLNTGTRQELLRIPGVGARMAHELEEYRPWKTQAQFRKEIGKYVNEKEVARLWRYVVIP